MTAINQLLRKQAADMPKRKEGLTDILIWIFAVLLFIVINTVLILSIHSIGQPFYLTLTQETAELHIGQTFDPMKYIEDYASSDGSLILPGAVNTSKPGRYAAVYCLDNGTKVLTRILLLTVEEKSSVE